MGKQINEDNLQEIFYIMTKNLGLSNEAASYIIQEYHKMFEEWYEEAEKDANAYKQYLLENKLENFIVRNNEKDQDELNF